MLLQIKGLKICYKIGAQDVEILRGVDLAVNKAECAAIIGESGSGKTTLGLAITKLLPDKTSFIRSGEILFEGKDLLDLDNDRLRNIRGKRISYVFQDPFSSLNPVFTIYEQLKEAINCDGDCAKMIEKVLKDVGLEKIIGKNKLYPFELSGGMQQRVMIAMAMIANPDILILDEPTTALDVTVQRQILELIAMLKKKTGVSILFISHDLRIVYEMADRIAIMYAGVIVEEGAKEDIFNKPLHPYTKALLDSLPSLGHRKQRFNAIKGKSPQFNNLPQGCKFYPRCNFRIDKCTEREPKEIVNGRLVRCIRALDI